MIIILGSRNVPVTMFGNFLVPTPSGRTLASTWQERAWDTNGE